MTEPTSKTTLQKAEPAKAETANGQSTDDKPGSRSAQRASLNGIGRVANWLKSLSARDEHDDLRDALSELIGESSADGSQFGSPAYHMLNNIVQLKERTVADCMCPRADIIAVESQMKFADLVRFVTAEAHSRYPIYRGHLDDVVGMVHIKDVMIALCEGREVSLEDMRRDVLFVPTTMPVMKLLMQMRTLRHNMAIVVDEYGGVDGLVSIEDLVEQIVGEIEDEHDEKDYAPVQQRGDGALIVDARMPLDDLEEQWGKFLSAEEREEYETVNGFILSLAGNVPARGARLNHPSGVQIGILEADARRVRRIRLSREDRAPIPDGTPAANSTSDKPEDAA